ncbi:hypothetical protein J6590_042334 [Homalodisca vitripennis]|nr:hypothetical protein J6590_042334 [Homalodisca vitripennis]
MTGEMRVRSGGVERGSEYGATNPTESFRLPAHSGGGSRIFECFLGGTYRRLETEVHKAKYGNRLSRSTPHHFSSVFAYGASRSHRQPKAVIGVLWNLVNLHDISDDSIQDRKLLPVSLLQLANLTPRLLGLDWNPTFACAGMLCDCNSRTRDLCSGPAFCDETTPRLDSKQLLGT